MTESEDIVITETPEAKSQQTDRINVSGATVTQHTAHLPEGQRELVRWGYYYAQDKGWNWKTLAKETDISTTTWHKLWHDRYRDADGTRVDPTSICGKIARFKKIAEQRDLITLPDFIDTYVWQRVDWLCQRSFIRKKIGFIYGESQIGKTECLMRRRDMNNHGRTTYVDMPPASGKQLMCKHIAKALRVPHEKPFDHLIEEIIKALDPSKQLLMDNMHRVFKTYQKGSALSCLDTLQYVYDKTHCSMVLCGTNVWRDQLNEGDFALALRQLRRRGLYELQLPAVAPREDLDAFAAHFNLKPATGEAEEIVLRIAQKDGLGMYITRLADGAELAAKKKETFTWAHFVKAYTIIEKMRVEDKGGTR